MRDLQLIALQGDVARTTAPEGWRTPGRWRVGERPRNALREGRTGLQAPGSMVKVNGGKICAFNWIRCDQP
jgi:hypothetical protein